MIVFVKRKNIDTEAWNKCIDNSVNSMVYARSEFLDIVSPNWSALISGDYQSVMPLPEKSKYGLKYIIQPVLCQQLGVFSTKEITKNDLESFLTKIPKKYVLVKMNLNSKNFFKENLFHSNNNYELSINNHIDYIRKSYSNNLKRNIKKAINNNISIKDEVDLQDVIRLFSDNKEQELENFNKNIYKFLPLVCNSENEAWKTSISGAYLENGKLIAGAVIISYNNRHTLIFTGNSEEGKQFGALPLLIDNFIKTHSEQNSIFDFEGSNNEGLARFYASFGSTLTHYPFYKRSFL